MTSTGELDIGYKIESEENMEYTYAELKIMLHETERAFDTMVKFSEFNNEFLTREDIKPLYKKFLLDKQHKLEEEV